MGPPRFLGHGTLGRSFGLFSRTVGAVPSRSWGRPCPGHRRGAFQPCLFGRLAGTKRWVGSTWTSIGWGSAGFDIVARTRGPEQGPMASLGSMKGWDRGAFHGAPREGPCRSCPFPRRHRPPGTTSPYIRGQNPTREEFREPTPGAPAVSRPQPPCRGQAPDLAFSRTRNPLDSVPNACGWFVHNRARMPP